MPASLLNNTKYFLHSFILLPCSKIGPWLLLAQYLSGEATANELLALQNITHQDPELKILIDTLKNYWQASHNSNIEKLNTVWQDHLSKLD